MAYATLPASAGEASPREALEARWPSSRAPRRGVAFEAHIHPDNVGSERVAAAAGFTVTGRSVDGERVWVLPPR